MPACGSFNPSTQEKKGWYLYSFEGSIIYILSARPAMVV